MSYKAILTLSVSLPCMVFAGSLDPVSGPGSTMYTLTELYEKLDVIDARTAASPGPVTNNSGAVAADVRDHQPERSHVANRRQPGVHQRLEDHCGQPTHQRRDVFLPPESEC